ncbi:putative component of type VI protein secretion system [Bradyrhizobium sp. GM22.5]
MSLTLKVENQTSLPDGGPLSVTIQGKGGIDIGRDAYLDWTLPDPSRTVSGRHCEIRWRDNSYWLHDTSSNGTFLMGAETRLPVPYRIRDGDRFVIGHYIVSASIQGGAADAPTAAAESKPSYDDIWQAVGEVAQPINPKQLKPQHALRCRPGLISSNGRSTFPQLTRGHPCARRVLRQARLLRSTKWVGRRAAGRRPRPPPPCLPSPTRGGRSGAMRFPLQRCSSRARR